MAWRKATGVLAAAIAGVLLLASPAYANETIQLKAVHSNNTAQEWLDKGNTADCNDEVFASLGKTPGEDAWHFILPDASGDAFVSVTLHFTKPDLTPVTVTLNSTSLQTGPGWRGYLKDAGQPGNTIHAYLITEAGWKLVDGSAEVTGSPEEGATFNISHVCVGKPSTSPSPSPSPSPSSSPSPSDSSSPGTSTEPGTSTTPDGDLPTTGVSLTGILAAGAGLIAGGTALLFLRRRRDTTAS